MPKMSNPQMNLILAAHNRPAKASPYGSRGEIVLSSRLYFSGEALRRNGWATPGSHGWLNVTRTGLIAAGVDMDALHAEALIEDMRRRVASAAQGQPEALAGTLGGPEMVLAALPLVIEQDHAEALAMRRRGAAISSAPERGDSEEPYPYQPGHPLADREPTAPAPMPTFAEIVYFAHEGRIVSGEVRSTITGALGGDRVVVHSRDLGHVHRVNDGVTVRVADLLPAPAPTPAEVALALDELARLRRLIETSANSARECHLQTRSADRIEALLRSEAR